MTRSTSAMSSKSINIVGYTGTFSQNGVQHGYHIVSVPPLPVASSFVVVATLEEWINRAGVSGWRVATPQQVDIICGDGYLPVRCMDTRSAVSAIRTSQLHPVSAIAQGHVLFVR